MAVVNPGNGIVFYDNLLDQVRFRTGDRNFHIPADNVELLSFELPFPYIPASVRILLIGRDIGQNNYNLSGNNHEIKCAANGERSWLINNIYENRPSFDCGFYYVQVITDQAVYYSEMLYLEEINQYESVGLVISDCTPPLFSLTEDDTLTTTRNSQTLELLTQPSGPWVNAGTNTMQVSTLASIYPTGDGSGGVTWEERFIRRTVETQAGARLQTTFRLLWDPDDPCNTATLSPVDHNNAHHRADRFILEVTNSKDLDNGGVALLYQTGYTQQVYLDGFLDFPQGETQIESAVTGDGELEVLSMVAKERRVIKFAKIPDSMLMFFQLLPKHDSVTLYGTAGGEEFELTEILVKVEPDAGKVFSTVELSWREIVTSFNGCPEDVATTDCFIIV
jgi:hypothetical protein